ncbi:MAG: elongation factor G [Kiritimatiellia bacterium]
MKDIAVTDVRTVVLLGHNGSGKTSLMDALLYKTGVNDRLGSVVGKSSMADYTDEEKDRGFTIHAKPFNMVYKGKAGKKTQLVFVDTPGFADFAGQVIMGSSVVESGLIVVDGLAGLQVGSSRAWKRCEDLKLPRGIVVTGLDRENASFAKTVEGIQAAWGGKCVPVVIPLDGAPGVADVLSGTPPASMADAVEALKMRIMEAVAETDDSLLEKYLGAGTLSPEEISKGVSKAVLGGNLVPIFACCPLKDSGLTELLEGLARMFPSPVDRPMRDAAGKPIDPAGPFCGFVWRTVNDPFIGQLTFMRVAAGKAAADHDHELLNITKGDKERISAFLEVNGKKQTPWSECGAGDIVALAKLKHTALCDVLGVPGATTAFAKYPFPSPVFSQAIHAKTQGDEDKIGTALARLAEEDPTIHVERHPDTHETVISGLGDMHLAVAVDRMKRRNSVDVDLTVPKVPYKETVTGMGEGHYKHKKQTGGRGQYGEVYLRVRRMPAGETEWFDDAVVGGVIPGNFMPAIQKGLVEGMARGSVAGYPVVNVKTTVYDGSYHDVDSSEIAFKIAGSRAFRDGMSKAHPVLLEPIMEVKVLFPDHYMGEVTGDLNHRRGRILGVGVEEGMEVMTAEVPMAELFMYSAELRSMTGGRGSFTMKFSRYEVVPSNVAQKVIAEAEKHKVEEVE